MGEMVRSVVSVHCRLLRRIIVNNKTVIVLILAGAFTLSGLPVTAQPATGQGTAASSKGGQGMSDQDIQLLRKDIRSQKKQLIAANLSLTDTEATKFWPIYDQYQAEYTKIGDAKLALIKEYAQNRDTVTDEQALDYLKRSEEISESVIQLRNKYVPLVNQVLPGKKTATFFQLERRIEMLIDVQAASEIPLLQRQVQ
jgi:Spy/CpxP family protein refolding chaperone